MVTRVKICGITRVADALAAAKLGADAVGLVFYEPSPRAVTIAAAAEITASLPPFVTSVALFVNPEVALVEQVIQQARVDVLQFHGDETPEFCAGFQRPYFKALRMQPGVDIAQLANGYTTAQGILLDAWLPGVPGGTGRTFDWQQIPQQISKPLILAGGLNVANVATAIAKAKPWAVDVSGGVEVSHGIKDMSKLSQFMQAVRQAG